jgi:hypothetical protein
MQFVKCLFDAPTQNRLPFLNHGEALFTLDTTTTATGMTKVVSHNKKNSAVRVEIGLSLGPDRAIGYLKTTMYMPDRNGVTVFTNPLVDLTLTLLDGTQEHYRLIRQRPVDTDPNKKQKI